MRRNIAIYRRIELSLASVLLLANPLLVLALTVTVKATVIMPLPCVINGDRPIEVEFNDVMTTRVDGKRYETPINYTFSCVGAPSNMMKLQVQGNGAAFDNTVLSTSKAGLGIELRQKDNKLPINRWLNFTYPNKPELWAVPVKQGSITLTGGEFSAAATLKVAYQ
ncbi:TPA: fimbrial protein [Serratia marcescens]|nr:fimbrial protein [Serratia marcescens]HCR2989105.1 fimbrial protein [Serratia marcescens]HCR3013047.1 fimbrial protein [Serratia marcescens]